MRVSLNLSRKAVQMVFGCGSQVENGTSLLCNSWGDPSCEFLRNAEINHVTESCIDHICVLGILFGQYPKTKNKKKQLYICNITAGSWKHWALYPASYSARTVQCHRMWYYYGYGEVYMGIIMMRKNWFGRILKPSKIICVTFCSREMSFASLGVREKKSCE